GGKDVDFVVCGPWEFLPALCPGPNPFALDKLACYEHSVLARQTNQGACPTPFKARFTQSDLSTPLFASVRINELFSETASFCKAPEGHRPRHQSTRPNLCRVRMMAAVRVSDCLERKNLPALN